MEHKEGKNEKGDKAWEKQHQERMKKMKELGNKLQKPVAAGIGLMTINNLLIAALGGMVLPPYLYMGGLALAAGPFIMDRKSGGGASKKQEKGHDSH